MISNIIREDLRDFMPYTTAKLTNGAETIRLHANESPWSAGNRDLNRYPQIFGGEELAKYYQVNAAEILVTRGSNEGIDLLVRLICRAEVDEILTLSPTYGMYEIAARMQNVKVNTVELREDQNFAVDADAIIQKLTPVIKIVFVCSPNNPTGTTIEITGIRKLCEATAQTAIIVIDEAYIEFADRSSAASLLEDCNNLVILRTLSKAFGLAGLRVGIVLANQEIIEWVRALMPPYPIPTPCQSLITQAIQSERVMQMWINVAMQKRSRLFLQTTLPSFKFIEKTFPSEANYILVKVANADSLVQFVAERGVLLRTIASLNNFIRISLGAEAENLQLLALFSEWEERDEM